MTEQFAGTGSGIERPKLIGALGNPAIEPGSIAGAVASALATDPEIWAWLAATADGALPRGAPLREAVARLGNDPLLLALMVTAVVPNADFERLFTALRGALLADIDAEAPGPEGLRLTVALAIQAFHTDYAWYVGNDEASAADDLIDRLDRRLREGAGADVPSHWLALAGAYRPLHQLEHANHLVNRPAWPDPIPALLRIQVREPFAERALRAQIPRLTPIVDDVSRQVRAQYEEHPYPRWVRVGRAPQRARLPHMLAALGLPAPADPSFATPDILVAGCGTGLQPVIASFAYEDARILAIDLSLSSLAYAWRKTRELGLRNIDYAQADLLEIGALDRRFHVIECGGVLHHLADPLAGWRGLVKLLRPGGIMNIGLYSELARTDVAQAREYIASRGYGATADDIRQCRRDLLALPDDHPLAALRRMRDLFNLSECRDLLFHVQEHRFTLPRIAAALDTLGLRFLGFNSPEHDDAYRRRFPADPRMTSLDNWHAFEQEHPGAFRGMYNFIVHKPQGA